MNQPTCMHSRKPLHWVLLAGLVAFALSFLLVPATQAHADDEFYYFENTTQGTKYTSVSTAYSEAKDGDTLKMLHDYKETGLFSDCIKFYDVKSITLDLNGCTLSNGGRSTLLALESGTVTIKDSGNGGQLYPGNEEAAVEIDYGATLNFESGKINSLDDAIIIGTDGGTFNMTGGTVSGGAGMSGDAIVVYGSKAKGIPSRVIISGGTVKAVDYTIYTSNKQTSIYDPQVSISGGTFTSGTEDFEINSATSASKKAITGGAFKHYIPSWFPADGYDVSRLSSGYYTVAQTGGSPVASIADGKNTCYFTSIGDAMAAAKNGDTVKVLRSGELGSWESPSKVTVTLDLNGRYITAVPGSNGCWGLSNGYLTVDDSSGGLAEVHSGSGCLFSAASDYNITLSAHSTYVSSDKIIQPQHMGHAYVTAGTFKSSATPIGALRDAKLEISGGSFYNYDPDTCHMMFSKTGTAVAEGYGVVSSQAGSDTVYTVTSCVAQVNDADGNRVGVYSTMQAALDAVQDGQTIVLRGPISTFGSATYSATGKTFTIDLNGETLYKSGLTAVSPAPLLSLSNCNVTITDLHDYYLGYSYGSITSYSCDAIAVSGGSLTLNKGTVAADGSNSRGIVASNGAKVIVEDTSDKEGDGAVLSSTNGSALYLQGNSSFDIRSGKVSGNYAITTSGKAGDSTITGGRIDATNSSATQDITTSSTGFAKGGTYTHEVPESQLASGYVCTQNEDGTYTVSKLEVASIGDTIYESLEAAIAAVQDGEIIKLLDDVAPASPVSFNGKNCTLDLNEHNITAADCTAIYIEGGSSLTITGSFKSNKITSDNSYAVYVAGGSLVVTGGSFEGSPVAIGVNTGSVSVDAAKSASIIGKIYGILADSDNGATISVSNGYVAGKTAAISMPNNTGSMSITGGTLSGAAITDDPVIDYVADEGFISGGHFGKAVLLEQCATGYIPGKDTSVTVGADDSVVPGWKVRFNANGGTLAEGTDELVGVSAGEAASQPDDPTRDGYEFLGWYTNEKGTGDEFDFSTVLTSDVTLYAKWKGSGAMHKVVFDANGGTLAEGTEDQEVEDGTYATQPKDPTPSSSDQAFIGWAMQQIGGSVFDFDNTPITDNITLYAYWIDKVVSVTTTEGATTYYGTLQEAISAAGENSTITVHQDLELENQALFTNKKVTLDLNGHTIKPANDDVQITLYATGSSLKITDSSENKDGKVQGQIAVALIDTDAFTIDSGTVSSSLCALFVRNNKSTPADIDITGGTVKSTYFYAVTLAGEQIDFSVTGGEVSVGETPGSSAGRAVSENGANNTVSITGGTFTTGASSANDIADQLEAGFISGGTFSKPVLLEQCAEGYYPVKNNDGTYTVAKGTPVASVTSEDGTVTYFLSMDDTFAAVDDGCTVKLLSSVEATSPVTLTKNIVLDLNGNTYNATSDVAFDLQGAEVIVTDTTLEGNGSIQGASTAVKLDGSSSLTVNKGTLAATGDSADAKAVWVNGGDNSTAKVDISDGVINGGSGSGIYLDGIGTTLDVKGGLVSGGAHAVDIVETGNTISITGGAFTSEGEAADIFVPESEGDFVSGGTFAHAVPLDQCAEGYVPVTNDDGTYTVAEGYVLAFDANSGKFADDTTSLVQTVKKDECATEPEEPTRDNYVFAGWYTLAEGGDEFDFTTAPTADTTVYAHWNEDLTPVDKPELTVSEDLAYNGEEQTGVTGFSTEAKGYTVSGDAKATNADTYQVTLTLAEGYVWSDGSKDPVVAKWRIAKKAATITVDNQSMLAGDAQPAYTGKVEGLVGNDKLEVTYGLEEGADTSVAGTYNIVPTGATPEATANNYDFTITNGTLTVSAAAASVTYAGKTTLYASLDAALEAAETDATVSLLADMSVDEPITMGKGLVLDLNGHAIESSGTSAITVGASDSGLIVCDSSKEGTGSISCSGGSAVVVGPGARFSVQSGSLTGTYAIYNQSKDGLLSISGGKLAGTKGGSEPDIYTPESSDQVYVRGGVFAHAVPQSQCAQDYYPASNTDETTKATYPYTVTNKAPTKVAKPTPTTATGLVYNGTAQTGVTVPASDAYTVTGATATDADSYTATITLAQGYVWEDGTSDAITVSWSIAPAQVAVPAKVTFTYDGTEKTALTVTDATPYSATGTVTATEVGDYTATLTLKDKKNTCWAGGGTDDVTYEWSITEAPTPEPTKVAKPTPTTATGLVYSGSEQAGVTVPASDAYTVTGAAATDAGSYTATITLKDGYVWEDGTSDAITVSWSIAQAQVAVPAKATFTYDGAEKTALTVTDATPYTATGTVTATEVGDYTATLTLKDKKNTCWAGGGTDDVAYEWSIVKGVDPTPTPDPDPQPTPTPDPSVNPGGGDGDNGGNGGSTTTTSTTTTAKASTTPQTGDNTLPFAAGAAVLVVVALVGLVVARRKHHG